MEERTVHQNVEQYKKTLSRSELFLASIVAAFKPIASEGLGIPSIYHSLIRDSWMATKTSILRWWASYVFLVQ